MDTTTAHPWRVRILLAAGACILTLCLGCTLPRLFMSDGTERWDGVDGIAARQAHNEVHYMRSPIQQLVTTRLRVIDVQPDPAGCVWGAPTPVTGVVTVQVYTLFGVPLEQWVVTCGSSRMTSSLLP